MVTGVLVVLVVPFLWSAAVAVTKYMHGLKNSPQHLDDKSEKRDLSLMLLPVLVGVAVSVAAQFVPASLPLPQMPLYDFGEAAIPSVAPAAAAAFAKPHVDWLHWAFAIGIALYGAGLTLNLMRLMIGLVRLRRLASHSRPAGDWGEGVRLTTAKITPLVMGRATILMPESLLRCLPPAQLQMILRHEREHLKRGDSRWFVTLAVIDTIFWFNPFVRHQTRRCRLAAELACDAAVVASAPEMRGTYAEALVRVLKHAAGDVRQYAPTAFSPETSGDYRMRITEIMRPPSRSGKPRLVGAAIAAALIVPLGIAQFAWSQVHAPLAAPVGAPAATAASPLTVVPVPGKINSGFGKRTNPVTHKPSVHTAVDFAAPMRTPVKASGDGTVATVVDERWKMGKVIEIDHGNGWRTRYAHLDSQVVKPGDHVTAGQVIAASGDSGVSVGPHLHFEVWHGDTPIDPATVLPLAK